MKLLRTHTPFRKRNLLYFVLALFVLSFFSGVYFKIQPSVNYQQRSLQRYIQQQQKDAELVLEDTALLRKLVLNQESPEEFQRMYDKRYGFFLFAETLSEEQDLLFWNNQKIVPPAADFSLKDGSYFQQFTEWLLCGVEKNATVFGYVE